MNKKHLLWIIPSCIVIGFFIGMFTSIEMENFLMKDYTLYHCVYNNADDNGFPENPYLVQRIQEECMCFFQHNFTATFEDC